jgi:hypothetical protein
MLKAVILQSLFEKNTKIRMRMMTIGYVPIVNGKTKRRNTIAELVAVH